MAPLGTPEGRDALKLMQADWLAALEAIQTENSRARAAERQQYLIEIDRLRRFAQRIAAGLVLMLILMIASTAAGIVVVGNQADNADETSKQVAGLLHEQQESRIRAIQDVCESRNDTKRGIRSFIRDVNPRLRRRAVRTFPLTRDCRAYAVKIGAAR